MPGSSATTPDSRPTGTKASSGPKRPSTCPTTTGVHVPEVQLWLSEDNAGSVSPESLGKLARLFREQTVEKLSGVGWNVVDSPGPQTLSVRLALTEAVGANAVGNVLTSVPYASTPAIQLTSRATDVHVFVGKASSEVQVVESRTGKVLAEGIDRRVGTHSLGNIGSTWGDVRDAIGVWSTRIARGLSKLGDESSE